MPSLEIQTISVILCFTILILVKVIHGHLLFTRFRNLKIRHTIQVNPHLNE